MRLAIRWATYLEFNPGKSVTWECSYCQDKGLQKERNCDGILDGQCPQHGTILFEDLEENDVTGKLKCPECHRPVKMKFSLRLGKKYWIWRCPLQDIDYRTLYFIKLVNWSESLHQTPSGRSILNESNLFFEIRDVVLQEQQIARKELEELNPKRDQHARKSVQGSRPPRMRPPSLPRRR